MKQKRQGTCANFSSDIQQHRWNHFCVRWLHQKLTSLGPLETGPVDIWQPQSDQQEWTVQCHIKPQQGLPRWLAACLFQSAIPGGFLCWFVLLCSSDDEPCSWHLLHLSHLGEKHQTRYTQSLFLQECWSLFHQYMWTSTVLVGLVWCLDYVWCAKQQNKEATL